MPVLPQERFEVYFVDKSIAPVVYLSKRLSDIKLLLTVDCLFHLFHISV